MNIISTILYEGESCERLPLYLRWIEYYKSIRHSLPWDKLLFIDNASSPQTIETIRRAAPEADIMSFSDRLVRHGPYIYPYWWRTLQAIQALSGFYAPDRLFWLEADFYVLSKSCASTLMSAENGWHSLWSYHYGIPASECQVIHGTGFDELRRFKVGDWMHDGLAERIVPLKSIQSLKGDRYGEFGITAIDPNWDYVGQLNSLDVQPVFQER